MKVIEKSAFYECKHLRQVTLHERLETLGEYCFQDSGLTELIIPNSVTEIKEYALSGCPDLKKVVLPKGLETIP